MPPLPPQQIWEENDAVDIIITPEPPSRQTNRVEMSLRLQQKVQKKTAMKGGNRARWRYARRESKQGETARGRQTPSPTEGESVSERKMFRTERGIGKIEELD